MTWDLDRWVITTTEKLPWAPARREPSFRGVIVLYASDGSVTYIPGGVLATSANIGDYERDSLRGRARSRLERGFSYYSPLVGPRRVFVSLLEQCLGTTWESSKPGCQSQFGSDRDTQLWDGRSQLACLPISIFLLFNSRTQLGL